MKGSYALIIRLNRAKRLTVGRLGEFYFPAGHYIYLGSALNGLESRVRRHLRRDKKLHWHVDYLTVVAGVCQVWWVGDGVRRECLWAQEALERGATVIAPGFGSSDCRCPTHLLYVEDWPGVGRLRPALMGGPPGDCPQGIYTPSATENSQSLKLWEQ